MCHRFGMSEEQFWRSNPRIIKVWEQTYKDDLSYKNGLLHSFVGTYFLSALTTAIDGCLNGKKAKAKYIDKPLDLFPKKVDKKEQEEQALAWFISWASLAESNYKK